MILICCWVFLDFNCYYNVFFYWVLIIFSYEASFSVLSCEKLHSVLVFYWVLVSIFLEVRWVCVYCVRLQKIRSWNHFVSIGFLSSISHQMVGISLCLLGFYPQSVIKWYHNRSVKYRHHFEVGISKVVYLQILIAAVLLTNSRHQDCLRLWVVSICYQATSKIILPPHKCHESSYSCQIKHQLI